MISKIQYKSDTELLRQVRQLGNRIGQTPLHNFSYLLPGKNITLLAKKEWLQLSGSIKARAAYNIMRHAIEQGRLHKTLTLLDATSGNTGIAYATIGQALGLPIALCLPENASAERKNILASLGAQIIYTSRFEGTDGAQEQARQLAGEFPDKYYYADQYKNDNNWKAHYNGTALEILAEAPGITHFIAGLGTTGTFTGTVRRLKKEKPGIKAVALQPSSALHGLEGWKHLETAIVPAFYDESLPDEVLETGTAEAYAIIKKVRQEEGLLLSPSAAANIAGALQLASGLETATIVTVLPDNADKYTEITQKIFEHDLL